MKKKLFFIGAALLGIFIFIFLFEDTFPTASLDLQITRTDALDKARQYLNDIGYDPEGYTTSVVFSGNRRNFVFLEKCLGLKKANERAKDDVPIWFWKVRFFKELQKEGFTVRVNPNGRIDGFSHHVEQRAPGAVLSEKEAREIVDDFLKQNNIQLVSLELL